MRKKVLAFAARSVYVVSMKFVAHEAGRGVFSILDPDGGLELVVVRGKKRRDAALAKANALAATGMGFDLIRRTVWSIKNAPANRAGEV